MIRTRLHVGNAGKIRTENPDYPDWKSVVCSGLLLVSSPDNKTKVRIQSGPDRIGSRRAPSKRRAGSMVAHKSDRASGSVKAGRRETL